MTADEALREMGYLAKGQRILNWDVDKVRITEWADAIEAELKALREKVGEERALLEAAEVFVPWYFHLEDSHLDHEYGAQIRNLLDAYRALMAEREGR